MQNITDFLSQFIMKYGTDIVWILLIFFAGRILLRLIIKKLVRIVDDGDDEHDSDQEKRAKTIGSLIMTIGNFVIYTIVMIMFLALFGVDVTPILAGVGVIGLAIGFGAQSLVKDFMTGLFILLENQYNVGDRVSIDGSEGNILKITIRSTVLKDKDEKIHYMPNGSIKKVINHSQKIRSEFKKKK